MYRDKVKTTGKYLLIISVFVASLLVIKNEFYTSDGSLSKKDCNVANISIEGHMAQTVSDMDPSSEPAGTYTLSDDVLNKIDEANNDDDIKAILIEVESGGGSPVAGQEIANALKRIKKPTVALIKDRGASAAYYAVTGTNYIIASNLSNVGSIGVTGSFTSNENSNVKNGITYNALYVGKYKEATEGDRALTEDERNRLMSDFKKQYDIFVSDVAINRHLKIADVYKIADGSTYVGNDALKLGLIDAIGDMETVKEHLFKLIGDDVSICFLSQ